MTHVCNTTCHLFFSLLALVGYVAAGVVLYNAYLKEEFDSHKAVTYSTFWPIVLLYLLIKYTYILIKIVLVSIYKTILDIPIFTTLKKKIEESKLPTLNSSNYRVINNIKERTQPW